MGKENMTQRLLLFVIIFFLALALSESILRFTSAVSGKVIFSKMTIDDPVLDWRLCPNYRQRNRDIRINGLGFRGHEFTEQKSANTIRILAIGDSCTFGTADIADSDTYPFLLETMLNAQDRGIGRYEVINAGVPGYTSRQCLLYFKNELLKFGPDAVIVYCGWNDIWTYRNPLSNTAASPLLRNISRFLARSVVFSLARDFAVNPLRFMLFRSKDCGCSSMRTVDSALEQKMLESFGNSIRGIIRLAASRGIKTVIVTLPSPLLGHVDDATTKQFTLHPMWQEGSGGARVLLQGINGIIRSTGNEGAAIFDCETVIGKYPQEKINAMFADAVHFNKRGNEAFSATLTPFILSLFAGETSHGSM